MIYVKIIFNERFYIYGRRKKALSDIKNAPEINSLPLENGESESSDFLQNTQSVGSVSDTKADSVEVSSEASLFENPENGENSTAADMDASDKRLTDEEENAPIYFPITDEELTAKNIDENIEKRLSEPTFSEVSDENTGSPDNDRSQSSISDIDSNIPEKSDVKEPVAVQIPPDEDVIPGEERPNKKLAEQSNRPIDNRFDFLELFVFTMVAVLVMTSFVFRHSIVDGRSMEGTLFHGEHLVISNLFYTPERGDVIVFQDYSKEKYGNKLTEPLVKRVIAVGGDTVRIYRDGTVYVNDLTTPIDESEYIHYSANEDAFDSYVDLYIPNFTYYPDLSYPEYIECTVPEGEVFVMGDHRNASTDSRYFGTVSTSAILGKVLIRFYPFSSFGVID